MDEIKQDESKNNSETDREPIPGQAKRKWRNLTLNYELEILTRADHTQSAHSLPGRLLQKERPYASTLQRLEKRVHALGADSPQRRTFQRRQSLTARV